VLLLLIGVGMAALLGYMELRHEVERVGPRNALVTNHFTGEVRNCYTYGGGDWSCHTIDIEPRSWVFALIPFWPARDDLGAKLHLSETWADETPFTETPLFSDLASNGVIGIVMLIVSIFIMCIKEDDDDGVSRGG